MAKKICHYEQLSCGFTYDIAYCSFPHCRASLENETSRRSSDEHCYLYDSGHTQGSASKSNQSSSPQPMLVRVEQPRKGKSFPSGHVISSVTFWGWFLALGVVYLKDKPGWYRLLLGIPIFLIVSIGPARVYLGDHWASDVLGGYLFSGGLLCLFTRWYLRLLDELTF